MKSTLILIVFIICYSFVECKLPSYINTCSRSKSNFNECAIKNGRAAIPAILNGDPSFHIPDFRPLKLDSISVQVGRDIEITENDVEIRGIEDVQLTEFNWDFDKKIIYIRVFIPIIYIQGRYSMKGRILIMDLAGDGPMNHAHYDNDIKSYVHYSLITKNGTEYMNLEKVESKIRILKGVKIHFENLLNNENISRQMNEILNENWQILLEEITPSLNLIFAKVVKQIIDPFTKEIPFDEIARP